MLVCWHTVSNDGALPQAPQFGSTSLPPHASWIGLMAVYGKREADIFTLGMRLLMWAVHALGALPSNDCSYDSM